MGVKGVQKVRYDHRSGDPVEIDEKVHPADNGKDHPPVGIAIGMGGSISH
jgi:hypothetical protein